MSRLIPICIIIGIIVIGHISKRIELHEINKRSDLTRDFRNKFIEQATAGQVGAEYIREQAEKQIDLLGRKLSLIGERDGA